MTRHITAVDRCFDPQATIADGIALGALILVTAAACVATVMLAAARSLGGPR